MVVTKKNHMDSDEGSKQKSSGDCLLSDSDFPKPIWVRYIGIQTNAINERLLEYNVRSVWIGICLFFVFLCVL